MGKVSLSITVDNEIYNLLNNRNNKSETINQVLKRALRTKEGIMAEIEHHKNQIELLTRELRQLEQRNNAKIENIPEVLKSRLREVKAILDRSPEKLDIWTEIINKNYNQNITQYELKKMIARWV